MSDFTNLTNSDRVVARQKQHQYILFHHIRSAETYYGILFKTLSMHTNAHSDSYVTLSQEQSVMMKVSS